MTSEDAREKPVCVICMEENKQCTCVVADGSFKVKSNSSFSHSVINMIGMLIGLGQLSTPYALENGGWISVFLLVGFGIACAYSSHIIGKCLRQNSKSNDYQDIGHHAFGKTGRVIAATFIYLEIFLSLVSYTISLNDNLAVVFSGAKGIRLSWLPIMSTTQLLTVVAVLIALPSLWLRDLSSISFLSFGGIIMSVLIFTMVGCTAIFGAVKANHTIPPLNLHNIPAVSGLYIFGFTGHIVFPNIYKSMKDPSRFTAVSITSFAIVTTLYTAMAFMGAKFFGPNVDSQITLSMPPHILFTKIALWATVLTPMTKYALEFAPFAMKLEHSLPESMSSQMRLLIRGCLGSSLLILVLALALSIPYFEHVLGLTGSLLSIGICVVLPSIFYMKICRKEMTKMTFVLNGGVTAVGIVLAVVGTISSSRSLITTIGENH
ncbi:hypothetical protein ZOSMA_166G00440 [Zostera marina]|uniref:Amino acid transporter transmembrane domain-containing protein n=1 Tax=Zostera marina TaxID=29655 RepID=A0A0K9PTP3_ZOSMR|nr:hypothetical protein ZOSMA_166G00440 [Zostera marina]